MKKTLLVAALAVVGAGAFFTPAAQAHHHDGWGNPYYNRGIGYGNPYYTNRSGFFRDNRHERHEIRRQERRAMRHWDRGLGRWY